MRAISVAVGYRSMLAWMDLSPDSALPPPSLDLPSVGREATWCDPLWKGKFMCSVHVVMGVVTSECCTS